jgi:hypothetical protein
LELALNVLFLLFLAVTAPLIGVLDYQRPGPSIT